MKILVAGLPNSGNRLIVRLLRAYGHEADIQHQVEGNAKERWERTVIPVRDYCLWKVSYGRNVGEYFPLHHYETLVANAPQPFLHVPYKLVQDWPEGMERVIAMWLGQEYRARWAPPEGNLTRADKRRNRELDREEVYDADRKHVLRLSASITNSDKRTS